MSQVRKYGIAAGTFAIAMGIGFVMQNGDALASRMVADAEAMPDGAGFADVGTLASASVLMPHMTVMEASPASAIAMPGDDVAPAMPEEPVLLAAAEADTPLGGAVMTDAAPTLITQAPDCTADLFAEQAFAATVDLRLVAPCAANQMVTIHHQGMIFTVLTNGAGIAEFNAPALAEDAVFIAELMGGGGAAAIVTLPEVAMYDRAVLQWQGETGLQLHAYEFGADFEGEGHVWSAAMRDESVVADGTGGYFMALGEADNELGHFAEVYTYPTAYTAQSGRVELTVDAEILASTCGREISAQSIQVSPGSDTTALDLTMTLPGCDAVGEFLVLSNMLSGFTLAAR